jgi:glutamate-1-semialdehyde 2,1-aminomutase
MVVRGEGGETLPRPGQIGRIHDPAGTTVVVPFNDIEALEQALCRGDIACVLAEPVMTNAGMVLPQPGFLAAVHVVCTRFDVPLVMDETHTLSSGLGGHARRHGLHADFLVCGKAIAGGVPCAVYGCSEEIAARIRAADAKREPGHSGIGTTLSGNPLALAALHAALHYLHTPEAYAHMEQGAARLAEGIGSLLRQRELDWHVSRVGARVEFAPGPAPVNARESLQAINHEVQDALHLLLLNRAVLLTPFHNMMLVSPATTPAQVDAALQALSDAFDALAPWMRAA